MNVNGINTGANAINWETLLSSLGEVEKTGSVEGKSEFTITTKDGDATTTMTVSIPDDLELPENVDKESLEGLVDKLAASGLGFTDEQIATMKDAITEMCKQTSSAVNEVNKKSRGNVMFDLYALMALMVDVAQSQRDASRDMRTAENQAVQKSIQDQADIQRSTAKTAMIVGAVCGAASALASLGVMAAQGITASQQNKIMTQSGADSAKMHSTALQNMDSTANANAHLESTTQKVGNEVATRVGNDFANQLVDDQVGDLKANFDNAKTALNTARQDVTVKETNLEAAQTTLGLKLGEKNAAQATYESKSATVQQKQQAYDNALANEQRNNQFFGNNAGTKDVETAKAALDAAKTEQNTAKTTLDNATQALNDQNQVVANCQRDLGLANDKVTSCETALNKAKADYVGTVRDVAAQYEEKYQTAVDRLSNPSAGDDKAQLKANVESAKADMEMAFAKEAQLLSDNDIVTQSDQKNIISSARARVDETMDRVYKRADFRSAERKLTALAGIGNINQAVGGVAQSVVQNWASMESAEATRKGADKTAEEEMLDQTKDLFKQEQDLIDQVVRLFSAVIQAETQSMRDAIQA